MKTCVVCFKELCGKQKRFCSRKCCETFHNHKYMSPENKEKRLSVNKKWRDKNKEAISANKGNYYQKHREKLLAIRKKYHKEHPEIDKKYKNSIKGKYMTYREGAMKRGFVFDLSLDYFKEHWNQKCVYCGDAIEGIGLDRADNKIGYTDKNTVDCCFMCNRMKHAFNTNDFINQCVKISNIWVR
jgi:hypothetical protein